MAVYFTAIHDARPYTRGEYENLWGTAPPAQRLAWEWPGGILGSSVRARGKTI